jgi:hypothetical protein
MEARRIERWLLDAGAQRIDGVTEQRGLMVVELASELERRHP